MTKVTLDWNCIIALEEKECTAPCVQKLIDLHDTGRVKVYLPDISAAEKTIGGEYYSRFHDFEKRICRLGLGHLPRLPTVVRFDMSYWGRHKWSGEKAQHLEEKLRSILLDAPTFDEFRCTNPRLSCKKARARWRNRVCDVVCLCNHIGAGHDIFVTTDERHFLKKKARLIALGAGQILRPCEAAKLAGEDDEGTNGSCSGS